MRESHYGCAKQSQVCDPGCYWFLALGFQSIARTDLPDGRESESTRRNSTL